jgi:hypothetical protein
LREGQSFDRFRRKELQGVKREFVSHMLAYNLSRAVALFEGFPDNLFKETIGVGI